MSNTNKGKRPLVADRRYPKAADKPKKKAAPKRRKRSPAPKRRGNILTRLVRWMLRLSWVGTSRATLVGLVVLGLAVGYVYITLPDLEDLLDGRARGAVTLADRDGAVFAWRGDQFGGAVTATSVSPALKNAVVATEDKRFYRHFGLSPRGIASAVRSVARSPVSISKSVAGGVMRWTLESIDAGQRQALARRAGTPGTSSRTSASCWSDLASEAKTRLR